MQGGKHGDKVLTSVRLVWKNFSRGWLSLSMPMLWKEIKQIGHYHLISFYFKIEQITLAIKLKHPHDKSCLSDKFNIF